MWQEEEEEEESYAQAALSPSSFYSLVPVEWSAHSLPRPLFMFYLPPHNCMASQISGIRWTGYDVSHSDEYS